jgi:hypothetical protein
MAPNTSDFIKDTRLEIEVFADHTIQTTFVSNPTTGQRRTQVHERWQRTKELGHGSFGVVRLEECTTGPSLGELRAVKELRKGTVDVSPNYYKELEAIAKFSQERVGTLDTLDKEYILIATSIETTSFALLVGTKTTAQSSLLWNTFPSVT